MTAVFHHRGDQPGFGLLWSKDFLKNTILEAVAPPINIWFRQWWSKNKSCCVFFFPGFSAYQANKQASLLSVWTARWSHWEMGLQLELQQWAEAAPLGLCCCHSRVLHCSAETLPFFRQCSHCILHCGLFFFHLSIHLVTFLVWPVFKEQERFFLIYKATTLFFLVLIFVFFYHESGRLEFACCLLSPVSAASDVFPSVADCHRCTNVAYHKIS